MATVEMLMSAKSDTKKNSFPQAWNLPLLLLHVSSLETLTFEREIQAKGFFATR